MCIRDRLHMKGFINANDKISGMGNGSRFYVKSPYKFRTVGKTGVAMSEHFQHLADPAVADELCVFHGCQAESVSHPTALYHMNTGNRFGGDPAVGAWAGYGLGSLNQDLPGYVVMTELAAPQGGSGNWSNGFLPAHYQGTQLRSEGSPILDLVPPAWKNREHQRRNLDVLKKLNLAHLKEHPQHRDLAARMENYELAYRMQMEATDAFDVNREPKHIRELYGKGTHARQLLIARRLVERGVRFVQVFADVAKTPGGGVTDVPWDAHSDISVNHGMCARSVDQPTGALLDDLKQRGLLDDTLVIYGGEFGRTSDSQGAKGRDHNPNAFTTWMAGGGVNGGTQYGATDTFGYKSVEKRVSAHDLHATILKLMGFDHEKLTYRFNGRDFRLSDVAGAVIAALIA